MIMELKERFQSFWTLFRSRLEKLTVGKGILTRARWSILLFFFNSNLQSLGILPSLTSKINVPIITVCNKQRRIFTVTMISKK